MNKTSSNKIIPEKVKKIFDENKRMILLFSMLIILIITGLVTEMVYTPPEDKENNEEKPSPENNNHYINDNNAELNHHNNHDKKQQLKEMELIGVVVDGKVKGNIKQDITGVTVKPGKYYAVLILDDKIIHGSAGDLILDEWELDNITRDEVVLSREGDKVKLRFLK